MEASIVAIDVTPLSSDERAELQYHETGMDRSEVEYIAHLQAIHDKKLYREQGTFEEYCVARHGFTANYARRIMRATEVRANLESVPIGTLLPTIESQIRPLTRLSPEDQPIAWQRAVDTAPNGKLTAAHVEQIVSEMHPRAVSQVFPYTCDTCGDRFGQPVWHCPGCDHHYHKEWDQECGNCHEYTSDGRRIDDALDPPMELEQVADQFPDELTTTDRELLQDEDQSALDSNEWYTPVEFIEAARAVMGGIDTDPASNDTAQAFIQAGTYYTKETNGLAQQWGARVWLNPPYAEPLPWIEKLLAEFEVGNTKQAILLVNTANSPQWSRLLWHSNFVVCLLDRRVRFWRPDRAEAKGTAQDQMIWYIGYEIDAFRDAFETYGAIR
jgi:phage N-6-adenine-methyltransferase